MTDAELIARLRGALTFKDLQFCPEAADLIETLIAERDTVMIAGEILAGICRSSVSRAEAAEDKLAKAVEALDRLVALNDDYSPFGGELLRDRVERTWQKARATLAEIKPITEWPEETGNIMVGKMKGESHE